MRTKLVIASWPHANRVHKHGGRGFKETDLYMVYIYMLLFHFDVSPILLIDASVFRRYILTLHSLIRPSITRVISRIRPKIHKDVCVVWAYYFSLKDVSYFW